MRIQFFLPLSYNETNLMPIILSLLNKDMHVYVSARRVYRSEVEIHPWNCIHGSFLLSVLFLYVCVRVRL